MATLLWQLICGDFEATIGPKEDDLNDPAIVPILAGLISIADWIGSCTDYFKFDCRSSIEDYFLHSKRLAKLALLDTGWLPQPDYAAQADFQEMFQFSPNSMQQTVKELISKKDGPYLLVVEAQMGQGKTEAAIFAADNALCNGQSRGLYIALPTQATSNAMFSRVQNDYLKERGHHNVEENLQLVHGNAMLQSMVALSDVGDSQNREEETTSAKSWFTARKRSLLAPIGIGTIDQALLSVLQTRHWFVRLFGLANKVVVFDEVHAYDTYTSTLLDHLIRWLSALNCNVILLSATLPNSRLKELVEAYSGTQPDEIADYPRVTLAASGECKSVWTGVDDTATKSVKLEFGSSEPSRVSEYISKRIKDGGCVAVICNTVDRAQVIYERLIKDISDCEHILFHARTLFEWRKETEDKVLQKFGKPDGQGNSNDRPFKAVVVATSVLEQSLDLDFDWILSDMAPIDLLLQRLGREHRHKREKRPSEFQTPIFTILSDGEIGGMPPKFENAGIYERYILLRSWIAITSQSQIELPGCIDPLVQWVYGNEEPNEHNEEWHEAFKASKEVQNSLLRLTPVCRNNSLSVG